MHKPPHQSILRFRSHIRDIPRSGCTQPHDREVGNGASHYLEVKRAVLLLLAVGLAACSSPPPYYSLTQSLPPKSALLVRTTGTIDAYKPAMGQASDLLTLEPSGPTMSPAPQMPALGRKGTTYTYTVGYATSLLARIPKGVAFDVASTHGDVNVTDIEGATIAHSDSGAVKVMVPGYAQASSGTGNVTVFMGATDWPGTLKFSSQSGDVEVWINQQAHFNVRMHTDHGTIFTDFGLTGTSKGESETINGAVGGSTKHGIDIEVANGSIRLLQLKPQI